jgi:hypothetical protein
MELFRRRHGRPRVLRRRCHGPIAEAMTASPRAQRTTRSGSHPAPLICGHRERGVCRRTLLPVVLRRSLEGNGAAARTPGAAPASAAAVPASCGCSRHCPCDEARKALALRGLARPPQPLSPAHLEHVPSACAWCAAPARIVDIVYFSAVSIRPGATGAGSDEIESFKARRAAMMLRTRLEVATLGAGREARLQSRAVARLLRRQVGDLAAVCALAFVAVGAGARGGRQRTSERLRVWPRVLCPRCASPTPTGPFELREPDRRPERRVP